MGLSNYIEMLMPDGQFSSELPSELLTLLVDNCSYVTSKYVSNGLQFCGKKYNYTCILIAKEGLYSDLTPEMCGKYYEKFLQFIQKVDDYSIMEDIQLIDNRFGRAIDAWHEIILGHYLACPNEIKDLCNIFKICSENNLYIRASY